MRPQKVGYCVGKAFFRDQLVCRDAASIDNGVNILFDDFRKMGLIFGREGRFYAGHYESPENNIVEQCYIFDLEQSSAERCALPAAGENKARKRKTAKLRSSLKKRAQSQPSGDLGMMVGHHFPRKNVRPPSRESEKK